VCSSDLIFISLLVLPTIISPIVAGATWRLLFDNKYGPINQIISWFAGQRVDVLITPKGALKSRLQECGFHAMIAPWARDACAAIDRALISLDRAWLDDAGLEGRPWFRSMLAASDKDSGYAATMLPLLTEAVDAGDANRVRAAVVRYQAVFDRLDRGIDQARAAMQSVSGGNGPPAPLGTR
jgi:hypothetical protein